MRLVADIEANNLLPIVTTVWCIVAKDIDTGEVFKYKPNEIEEGIDKIYGADTLIMHNGIGYDLPLLKKLHNRVYTGDIVDTLVMSRLLYPDRPLPKGYVGRSPHSVEAWGYRVGRGKPEHNDWSRYSSAMLYRCEQDVEITEMIFYELEKEKKR